MSVVATAGADRAAAPPSSLADVDPYALDPAEVAELLATDPVAGLTPAEVERRLRRFGENVLRPPAPPAYLRIALRQFVDPLVLLLVVAAVVSASIGDVMEGSAIGAVVVLNAAIGFFLEASAARAMVALASSYTVPAAVVRAGREFTVPGETVVPGDLLHLRAGDRVPADARVVAAHGLETDESALTGESLPVAKDAVAVALGSSLAERPSMVYAGTAVTRGGGHALVCATGRATEVGRVDELTATAKISNTPLERRLALLARQMVVVGVIVTVGLAALMMARGSSVHTAFLVGVAVAVAAVPEGLVASITGTLALGSRDLSRRGAIVRRLDAIESLGETTVICTDKTGTLTEGHLRLAGICSADRYADRDVLLSGLLASSPAVEGISDPELVRDALDAALLLGAIERGITLAAATEGRELLHEIPFTAARGRETVVWKEPTGPVVYVKGAPESLARRAREYPQRIAAAEQAWTGEGLRVIAVGRSALDDASVSDEMDSGVEILGALALHDPLRPTAAGAVGAARAAGIEVKMITGDHPRTARAIAHALELPERDVFARATPEDKLRLVEALQREGEIVAVTGDGINDAPALRRADVGVAMGRSGTEAAREAAAIVLTDDDFATIVAAVAGGRRIVDNINKVVAFLLSANLGEVLLFGVAVGAALGVPLAVIQVLLVNLVTDGLPALALARDPASAETMTTGPRRERALFDLRAWTGLALIGVLIGSVSLGAFLIGRSTDIEHGQTMAFAALAFAELLFVFSCRSWRLAPWSLPPNWWLFAAVVASAAVAVAVIYVPVLHGPFNTVALTGGQLVLALALAVVPVTAVEVWKAVRRHRQT